MAGPVTLAFLIILFSKFYPCLAQSSSCVSDSQPCFPDVFSLTSELDLDRQLIVSSTCGSVLDEQFCYTSGCSFCNSSSNTKANLVDSNLNSFWKSRNLDTNVTITASVGRPFLLQYVLVSFTFDVPKSWILQVSRDFGITYSILAYFSVDCTADFGMRPSSGPSGVDVLCYQLGSEKDVFYSPYGDLTVDNSVKTGVASVLRHFTFTDLQLVLVSYKTPSNFNVSTAIKSQFFFAISNLKIEASCLCNGMASECIGSSLATKQCSCQKNSEGDSCDRCKPLFNAQQWTYGQTCIACKCNSLASSCVYSASIGRYICQNCSFNTEGYECEKCKAGFYRDPSAGLLTPCQACSCSIVGSQNGSFCERSTGTCSCKLGTTGRLCDTCLDSYFGFGTDPVLGCKACSCNIKAVLGGSPVCSKSTGQCPCVEGVGGKTCDVCLDGYYGSPPQCSPCGCNPLGSFRSSCSQLGACSCKTLFDGMQCEKTKEGYHQPSLFDLSFDISSTSPGVFSISNLLDSSETNTYIHGYDLRINSSYSYTLTLPSDGVYSIVIQYQVPVSVFMLRYQLLMSSAVLYSGSFNMTAEKAAVNITTVSLYKRTLLLIVSTLSVTERSYGSSSLGVLGQAIIVPSLMYYASSITIPSAVQGAMLTYINKIYQFSWVNAYMTDGIYISRNFSYVLSSLYSDALACNCSAVGTVTPSTGCNPYTGFCSCRENFIGASCDRCRPGFYLMNGVCVVCGCYGNGSLSQSCDARTGQCPCLPGVVGRICDSCLPNFYGVSSGMGCTSCSCNPAYSLSPRCDPVSGQCPCKLNVGGGTCNQCLPTSFGLSSSGCQPCSCTKVGTLNNQGTCRADGSCICKANVALSTCSECRPGYYGLSADLPGGCLKCFCYGWTTSCREQTGWTVGTVSTKLYSFNDSTPLDGWTMVSLGRDNSVQNTSSSPYLDLNGKFSSYQGFMTMDLTSADGDAFFSAGPKFLGLRRFSYSLYLSFQLSVSTSAPIRSTAGDIILIGGPQSMVLVASLPAMPELFPKFTKYQVRLLEDSWKVANTTNRMATSDELMTVLSLLQFLLIRASWAKAPTTSYLADIEVQTSVQVGDASTPINNMEFCYCPAGYQRPYCDTCAAGYTRSTSVSSVGARGCALCSCNQHSRTCDAETGTCYGCAGNTMGDLCELCMPGYYRPLGAVPVTDCLPCPCPRGPDSAYQYASSCNPTTAGGVVCENCMLGYLGKNCEICADGYYGDPKNGPCVPCDCSGNTDPSAVGNCNTTTGECLKCLNNTSGPRCEQCKDGFYRDPSTGSCVACVCSDGASNGACDKATGECICLANVQGAMCDRCAPGYWSFTAGVGCSPCVCDIVGSESSECDQITGLCKCKDNFSGTKCDRCSDGYYLNQFFCVPCLCNGSFSSSSICDRRTGQCKCSSALIGGRACDQCSADSYGDPPNCTMCSEPCDIHWQGLLSTERTRLVEVNDQVMAYYKSFQGRNISDISLELSRVENDLSMVDAAFSVRNGSISSVLELINKINTNLTQFSSLLDSTSQTANAADRALAESKQFNGSVGVKPTQESSLLIIDITHLQNLAAALNATLWQQNLTASSLFSNIDGNFSMIVDANQTAIQLVSQVNSNLGLLLDAERELNRSQAYLRDVFGPTQQANQNQLATLQSSISQLQGGWNASLARLSQLDAMLRDTGVFLQSANLTLLENQQFVTSIAAEVSKARQKLSAIRGNIETLKSSLVDLKVDLSTSMASLEDANRTAAEALSSLARIYAEALNLTAVALKITNQQLLVNTDSLQALYQKIVDLPIDQLRLNNTIQMASLAVVQANQLNVQARNSLESARRILDFAATLEANITVLERTVSGAMLLLNSNQQLLGSINVQSQQVLDFFKVLPAQGSELLSAVKGVLDSIAGASASLFASQAMVPNIASNLNLTAGDLYAVNQTHQENVLKYSVYSQAVDSAYSSAMSSRSQIDLAQKDLDFIQQEVSNMDNLIKTVLSQRDRLDLIASEADRISQDIDQLMSQIEAEQARLDQCSVDL